MNSRDIYMKIAEKMQEDGIQFTILSSQQEKEKIIESMNRALIEYSYEKLCEAAMPEQIVMDLGVILDTIDSFLVQKEKEEFFQHYVHCMLNVYNNIENKALLWSPEDTTNPEEFPKFEKEGEYLEFFKTDINSNNKKNALWLNEYLSTTYSHSHKVVKNNIN
ncbi:MAG: hypothetical protein PUE33_03090 [bacterium]|nr:hypothetical protein [bacterium]